MKLIKACCIAFSMFSKLPVPQFEWKEDEMKYMMVFFPLVGSIIGLVVYGWSVLAQSTSMNGLLYSTIGVVIPIVISGGIHVDGYMDTMDAIHSYQSKERKLEILSDPHVGAFSVIYLLVYYLIYMGSFAQVQGQSALILLSLGFFLSRILCAIGTMTFPGAKETGLCHQFAKQADKKRVIFFLALQLVLCMIGMILTHRWMGSALVLGNILLMSYYGWLTKQEFGGTTGDTSGFFVILSEGLTVGLLALGCVFQWL